jgi:hypothetical protein
MHTHRALLHATLGDYARFYRCVGFATSIFDSMSAVRAMRIDAVKRGDTRVVIPPPLPEETRYMLQVEHHYSLTVRYSKGCVTHDYCAPTMFVCCVAVYC